jgi:hypothetical protein
MEEKSESERKATIAYSQDGRFFLKKKGFLFYSTVQGVGIAYVAETNPAGFTTGN